MAKPHRVSPSPSGERKPEEEIGFFGNNDEEDEDYDEDEDVDYDEEEQEEEEPEPPKSRTRESQTRVDRLKLENLARRMQSETVPLRVHDVVIKGNTKTKDFLIEAETAPLRDLNTMQDLLNAVGIVSYRLQALEVFDSVKITLDSGPPELPGTSNVIVEVVETQSPLTGEFGAYSKGEAKSSTFEGSLKYKNLFGYGDLWDGSLVYGFDQSTEVSAGVHLPRLKGLITPVTARLSRLNQDRLRFCSYKERLMGLSLGLFSTKYHDLVYNLSWRTLTDPSQMASRSVRRQLGHSLLSSLKYTFKIDRRNSPLRPTQGYAFVSTTQLGGLAPDSRSLRFLRQEFDFHYAVPLGFYHAAINFGISGGVVFPWGKGFLDMASPLPERFFLGGNLSPVCTLGGPSAFWGFRTRGLGPTEFRRQNIGNQNIENADIDVDYLGGDLAVTAFADLSFDLPLRWCREKGIHGHIFAAAGNVAKLTENAHRSFSFQKFAESFRSSAGVGLVVPTSLFRMELNYCYILKKLDLDRGKCGFRVSFSTSL